MLSIRTGATSASRCSAPLTGFFPCSAGTVAGPHSTRITTAWCSSTSHSPITTPCWIRRPWTLPGASWSVNYIYGTMLVLRGLEAMEIDHHEPYVQQAAEWIRMVQNPDGGWGETCDSYDDSSTKGVGPSTPSQTAWAILGLLAAQDTRSDCVVRGIAYLVRSQKKDGSWDEPHFTGTGFPRVFYLMYHMYRQYFPLIALTTYKKVMAERSSS